jgi:hypothetical protein
MKSGPQEPGRQTRHEQKAISSRACNFTPELLTRAHRTLIFTVLSTYKKNSFFFFFSLFLFGFSFLIGWLSLSLFLSLSLSLFPPSPPPILGRKNYLCIWEGKRVLGIQLDPMCE